MFRFYLTFERCKQKYTQYSRNRHIILLYRKDMFWEFPGGPVVRTLCFHCRGPSSIPGWGTKIPPPHTQKICFSFVFNSFHKMSNVLLVFLELKEMIENI